MRVLALLLIAPALSLAQSMEPRAYSNAPTGMNFLLVGYGYTVGDVGFDATVPLENGKARIHSLPVGYVRSLDVFGRGGNIALLLPFADMTATATVGGTTQARREVTGLADPAVRLAVNFLGAPALDAQEFASYRQDLIVGTSLTVTAPLGQYDPSRLINLGSNRWSVKPELGISQSLGAWTVELAAGATWFTDNDDFYNGRTRTQEPLYSAQVHVTRQLARGMWAAVSATHYEGGRPAVDGVVRGDRLSGTRAAATFALPIGRRDSLKLSASSGLYARTGSDYDGIGLTWQHVWQ
jgi:hypothetical protein